jgi:hypothetical protein
MPMIEKQAREEQARYDADHPFERTCLFCKRRHRNPRRVVVVEKNGRERVRWASRGCIQRRVGLLRSEEVPSHVTVRR